MLFKPPVPALTETRGKRRGRGKALPRDMGAERVPRSLRSAVLQAQMFQGPLEAANCVGRVPRSSREGLMAASAVSAGMPHQRAQLHFCRNGHTIPLLQVFPLTSLLSHAWRDMS